MQREDDPLGYQEYRRRRTLQFSGVRIWLARWTLSTIITPIPVNHFGAVRTCTESVRGHIDDVV